MIIWKLWWKAATETWESQRWSVRFIEIPTLFLGLNVIYWAMEVFQPSQSQFTMAVALYLLYCSMLCTPGVLLDHWNHHHQSACLWHPSRSIYQSHASQASICTERCSESLALHRWCDITWILNMIILIYEKNNTNLLLEL